jgi:hypothetical protein
MPINALVSQVVLKKTLHLKMSDTVKRGQTQRAGLMTPEKGHPESQERCEGRTTASQIKREGLFSYFLPTLHPHQP